MSSPLTDFYPTLTPERRRLVHHPLHVLIQAKLDTLFDKGVDTSDLQSNLDKADFILALPESSPFCVYGLVGAKTIILQIKHSAKVHSQLISAGFYCIYDNLYNHSDGWVLNIKRF